MYPAFLSSFTVPHSPLQNAGHIMKNNAADIGRVEDGDGVEMRLFFS